MVRLIGRTGCREPTGAVVRLKLPSGDQVRLQTGGDGFLVTNERLLHFSVPPGIETAELEVRWPGGETQRWATIGAGREMLLIEGRPDAVGLREFPAP
jgi:hypothetical protein